MKIKGKKIEGRNVEVIVIPRGMGCEDIVFLAEAIPDFDEFEAMVPGPEAPEILRPGGIREQNVNDPKYREALEQYAADKTDYTVLKSLEKTEELEWETIDMKDPETWSNWRQEMMDGGMTDIEVMHVIEGVSNANSLSDTMLEEARENFIRSQAEQAAVESSLPAALPIT